MKTAYSILLLAVSIMAGAIHMRAQSLNVVRGNVSYSFKADNVGPMNYSNGETITIQGVEFALNDIDRMEVVATEVADGEVLVEYADEAARVVVAGNLRGYVAATIDGANVSIAQSNEVSEATCGEITYILRGATAVGSFAMSGSYKASVELQGLTLTNPYGSAINLQNGKRTKLKIKKETFNSLTDASGGSQKACIYCKGHLEISGKGTLNIEANTSHAISAKEYVELQNATINISRAIKDGINCNQYFLMESGALTIANVGDDGVQVSFKDATDREAEDTGALTIAGGNLNITTTAPAAKALKADGTISVSDGEIVALTTGGGLWDTSNSKTKAAACLSAAARVDISGGTLQLTSTGGGGKGISCDDELAISGGTITISTTGGMVAYSNGTINQNYTGNADNLQSKYKSSPKGIKADGNVNITGGVINVSTTGNGGEGIESKATLTISDGYIAVRAYDDAINSAQTMYIKGGEIEVIAANNDGLDSNGDLYIEGGVVKAFGATSPECGLDANEEQGYTVYFTGGMILAAGGNNSTPSNSKSTQPYVSANVSLTAGSTVSIASADQTLYTFTIPTDYKSSGSSGSTGGNTRPGGPGGGFGGSSGSGSVLISVPGLSSGSSYTVTSGSSSATATAQLYGNSSGPGGRW